MAPRARVPLLQHMVDTYESETQKTISVWRRFADAELSFRPHEKSTAVGDIMKHELLSQRRFFAEFLGFPEPAAADVLPAATVAGYSERLLEHATARLNRLADQPEEWWKEAVPFFDVTRERAWIVLRRMLHTAHHRTQLTVYLRFLGKPVPAVYGPSKDESWAGADPTASVDAASRR